MEIPELLEILVGHGRRIFRNNLVGVYLHGSAAMDCFNPKKSDLDLLIIIENEAVYEQKKLLMEEIVALNKAAPVKGIEMSLVRSEYCSDMINRIGI